MILIYSCAMLYSITDIQLYPLASPTLQTVDRLKDPLTWSCVYQATGCFLSLAGKHSKQWNICREKTLQLNRTFHILLFVLQTLRRGRQWSSRRKNTKKREMESVAARWSEWNRRRVSLFSAVAPLLPYTHFNPFTSESGLIKIQSCTTYPHAAKLNTNKQTLKEHHFFLWNQKLGKIQFSLPFSLKGKIWWGNKSK